MATTKKDEVQKKDQGSAKTSDEPKDLKLTFKVIGDKEEDRKFRRSEYTVKANELEFVHVEVEEVDFDRRGNKKSRPRVVIVDPRQWIVFRNNAQKVGFTYRRVLYAPKGAHQDFPVIRSQAEINKEARTAALIAQLEEAGLKVVPK